MTNRIAGFVVALDEDIREDDVEATLNAILHIKHVINVEPIISNAAEWIAEQRVRQDLTVKLLTVLRPDMAKRTG